MEYSDFESPIWKILQAVSILSPILGLLIFLWKKLVKEFLTKLLGEEKVQIISAYLKMMILIYLVSSAGYLYGKYRDYFSFKDSVLDAFVDFLAFITITSIFTIMAGLVLLNKSIKK